MTQAATAQELLKVLHTRIYDKRNKRYGWAPTAGQVKVGKALLVDGKKRLFIQCGRKWGKTEFVIYILLRWAVLHPGSTCAYFGPKRNLARTIIWKRLKSFIPKEFLKDGSLDAFKEQTLEVRLWNDSTIVVDGTADPDSGRGVEPHIVVYDEYKDHKDGFREAMEANLEVYDAVEVFIGTPPDHENHFTEMAEEIKNDPNGFFIEAPSRDGPVYSTPQGLAKLAKIREKYERIGDLAYFIREYEGRFVRGGKGAIFPMWDPDKMVFDPQTLADEISKDKLKHHWYTLSDPGTTTVFAVLIAAINPYTKTVYLLDEIYEDNPSETSAGRIWPRTEALMGLHCSQIPAEDFRWYKGYDQAAAWYAGEVSDLTRGRIGLSPTNKALMDKTNGLSLIKDQMQRGMLKVSANCERFVWEVSNYVKDNSGNIPKENDHLIDCARYLNSAAGYTFEPELDAPDRFKERGWRAVRPADDYDLEDHFGSDDDFV